MPQNDPVTVTAAEIARQFSHFSDVALTTPVIVTKNGRERNVILSIDEYHRLMSRSRTAYRAEDTPDVFMREIDRLIDEIPEAQRYALGKRMHPPPPKPGAIIRYDYNWFADYDAGIAKPVRPHPSVVMAIAVVGHDRHTDVLVLAITQAPPYDPDDALEIPEAVKAAAGLDAFPQWVVIAESNVFTWPGPDLRHVPGVVPETYLHGMMPGPFLRTIALAFKAKNRGSSVSGRQVRRPEDGGAS